MKILYVLSKPFGTIGTAAAYMIPSTMVDLGNEVYMLAPEESKGSRKVARIFDNPKLNFSYYDSNISALNFALFIKNKVVETQADIVHVFFNRFVFLYPLITKFFGFNKSKWILDIRSPLISSGIKRWCARALGPIEQIGYNIITAHTLASAQNVLTILFTKTIEIPPGVNIRKFDPKNNLTISKRPVKLIYVGSIAKERKLETLIEGIAQAYKDICDKTEFIVDFYGSGNALQELKNKVKEMQLSDIIQFRGTLQQNELFKKMNKYDIGIAYIPKEKYNYAPGLKTLEYMAASLLIIASNTAGNRKYIENEVSGILMENSPNGISRAIEKAIQKSGTNDYIINAHRIVADLDWHTIVVNKLYPVYDQLLK